MSDPTQPAKPESYYQGINQHLFDAVPTTALAILEVGCAEGKLGALLKERDPKRRVYGAELMPDAAARASQRLDRVFRVDIEADEIDLPAGSLDCITYGDVLEHLRDPERVLARHRKLLGPGGRVVCSIPNVQHHSIFSALARGDFQYAESGLLDATHLRFFTYSTFIKLLLDAGYAPHLETAIESKAPLGALEAVAPLLEKWGTDPVRAARYLDAFQYIFSGVPLGDDVAKDLDGATGEPERPISFVVLESDEPRLLANLLASPCLASGSPHEVLRIRDAKSAGEGLNRGLEQARHPTVVFVHQDVYLPRWWTRQLVRQLARAEADGGYGVAGVYGIASSGGQRRGVGRVVDRDRMLDGDTPLPAPVDTLDELLLVVPKGTPLRADPSLGFHFYGADLCLQARKRGLRALALDALCHHNSLNADDMGADFYESGRAFARKWRAELPVTTTAATVDASWTTTNGRPRSAAPAFTQVQKLLRRYFDERRARRVRRDP